LKDKAGRYHDNFQNGNQLSYSIAYPWMADGSAAPYWKATIDASIPLMSDVAPLQGTGTPPGLAADVIAKPLTRSANSANHEGDGQNVVFGDNHVEFTRLPTCGQSSDNIFTSSGSPSTGPLEFGGIPAGTAAPTLTATKAPYDIVMLPVRNSTTGGY
jgi:hypothetical protein